jgi:DNA repair protein RecN (Recombination protein N)
MISYIHIHNFAIIEEEEIKLHPNFSALTGETGAGKSIILEAITLILGGRASADMIRQGQEQASVMLCFKLKPKYQALINQRLEQLKHPILSVNDELKIQRVISSNGKNKITMNGLSIKQAELKDLTEGLIEIVRQHASHVLLDPEQHISLLDGFGKLLEQRERVSQKYDKYQSLEQEVKQLTQSQAQRKAKIQQIEKQVNQIEKINPESGEDDRIEKELRMLQSSERLKRWLDEASQQIYDQPHSIVDLLSTLGKNLEKLIDLDDRLTDFHEVIMGASMGLSELHRDLKRFKNEISNVQSRMQELEERRAELDRLKDEYELSIEEILAQVSRLKAEKDELVALDFRLKGLDKLVKQALEEAQQEAEILSLCRVESANRLAALIEEELQTLGMSKCRFLVDVKKTKLYRLGLEQIEFLISPNPGEGFKPLAKIASGGELSRLTLAIKVLMMHQDDTPTYVFDEVDSGIGGGVAEGVGKKLKRIALSRQVLCITHLPQVAACADQHYKIEKQHTENRTYSSIALLNESDRIQEMARMLGGQDLTEATILHAKEMIKRGQKSIDPLSR